MSFDHSIFELNCLVHGDDPRNVFPVKITSTESVGTLKDAIKAVRKPTFDHLRADALKLWKVSIAVADGFKENAKQVEVKNEEALSPVDPLSNKFTDTPARNHVHIMVIPVPGEY
jgi:hypothetical protein